MHAWHMLCLATYQRQWFGTEEEKKVHAPTWTSSNCSQVPRTLVSRLFTVVCTEAPVAEATRFRSSSATYNQ